MPSQLVRDKLATGKLDFFSHVQSDKSLLINGASLALSAVQKILHTNSSSPYTLSAAVSASGLLETSIKRGLGILGNKFTLGPNIETAVGRAVRAERARPHTSHSFDMLGEGARSADDAGRYLQTYIDAAKYIAAAPHVHQPQMSVKLSSLCPRFDELSRTTAVGAVGLSAS
jgi:RHH-type proline utilization regulon transcriptional repressor/proline dehydrogenase/delta 1-pyrroline-5-carboxylate dehydrogenase